MEINHAIEVPVERMKNKLKVFLEQHGWYIRKTAGISSGVNIFYDIQHRLRADINLLIDVGAHHGETVDDFKQYFPVARVVAFEPIVKNFEALKQKSVQWKNVSIENFALAEKAGRASIVLQADSQTNSLQNITENTGLNNVELIDIITLDDYTATQNINHIDFLKIDVEGFEIQVLKGAKNLLTEKRIKMIFAEASLDKTDQVHTQLSALQTYLEPFNFNLTGIYDQVMFEHPSRLGFFNALFVQSD